MLLKNRKCRLESNPNKMNRAFNLEIIEKMNIK